MKTWGLFIVACLSSQANLVTPIEQNKICSLDYCIPPGYQKGVLPPTTTGNGKKPLQISMEYDVSQITTIDDDNNFMTLAMYMSASWQDPRLEFVGNESKPIQERLQVVDARLKEKLWLPDLFIYNLKEVYSNSLHDKFESRFLLL